MTYPGSVVKDFTLKSIAYACVLESGGNLDAPTSCTTQATAYQGNTKVGMVNLGYTPSTLLGSGGVTTQLQAGMNVYRFPASFSKVTRVEFKVVEPVPITTAVNFVIDDTFFTTDERC